MSRNSDIELVKYVRKQLNSGNLKIIISSNLLNNVDNDTLVEIKRLCKLAGASLTINYNFNGK